jgi:Mg-chelatase subunit ChlD
VSKFYKTLNRVFIDKVRSLPVTRNRGNHILNNKLAGIPAGNMSVFKNMVPKTEITSDVCILVDASGSMYFEQMKEANKTSYALAKALAKMKIDSQVTYFGCWEDNNKGQNYLYNAKAFKQPLKKERFSVDSLGSTPTHDGLMYSMMSLALKRSNNKIIFLITDGDPNSIVEVERMADMAKRMGIKIVPIGLAVKSVRGFDEGSVITAENSSAVNDALQQAIKLRLFA